MSAARTLVVTVPRPIDLLLALAKVIPEADLHPTQRADLALRVSDVLRHEVHGFGRGMRLAFLDAATWQPKAAS